MLEIKKKKIVCVEGGGCRGCRGGGGWQRDAGGRCAACPGVGSGLMADAGDNGSPAEALCHCSSVCGRRQLHGWVSNHYTEHLQTDKKTKPSGTNGNFCFPFSSCTLSPLTSPLERRASEEGEGGRTALWAPPAPSLAATHPLPGPPTCTGASDLRDPTAPRTPGYSRKTLFSRVPLGIQPPGAIKPKGAWGFHIWPPLDPPSL